MAREILESEGTVGAVTGGNVTVVIDDDRCAFLPSRAVRRNPVAGCPFTDVVSARKDSGALDVTDLDDVFVLGEYVTELLAGSAVSHGTVDVFQNFSSVAWSIS